MERVVIHVDQMNCGGTVLKGVTNAISKLQVVVPTAMAGTYTMLQPFWAVST